MATPQEIRAQNASEREKIRKDRNWMSQRNCSGNKEWVSGYMKDGKWVNGYCRNPKREMHSIQVLRR